jgi:DNA-directed RNA polymerase I and III subunit RPAC2
MAPKKKTTEVAADDVIMDDAPIDTGSLDYDGPVSPDEDRIRIVSTSRARYSRNCAKENVQLPGSSDTAASFEFKKEDHTLGNALRYIIMKKYATNPTKCTFI